MTEIIVTTTARPRPSQIPSHTMDSLCARLNAAILRAKSDPETALRCAEWKKQNKEEKC